jgi:glutathione S-transferase
MKLYNHDFSPNAKRVRVAAREAGVNFETVQIDFAKGEHKAPAYVAKNPNGKVPTFEDTDGTIIWESPAILVYLAEKHPEKNLLPKDAINRTDALRWMFWNASHLEAAIFAVGFERIVKPMLLKKPTDEARVAIGIADFNQHAPVLNAHLEGKDWILGKQFTIADIALGTSMEFGTMAKLDLAQYTHLSAWLGRLQARDSWKKG